MTEKYRNPLLYIEVIDVSSMREVCDMSRLTQFPFSINLSAALRESISNSLSGVALLLWSEVLGHSLKILKCILLLSPPSLLLFFKRESVKIQILILLILQLLLLLLLLLILKLRLVIASTTAATALLQLLFLLFPLLVIKHLHNFAFCNILLI